MPSPSMSEIVWSSFAFATRNMRTLVRSFLLSVVILAIGLLLSPRPYTVRATLRPQGAGVSTAGQLSSLAAQFGVVVPGGDGIDSPAFFAEFLQSWEVTFAVAGGVFEVDSGRFVKLVDHLEIRGDDSRRRQEVARRWLERRAVRIGIGRESGTVFVEVRTKNPRLSRAIAASYLSLADSFNVRIRQDQANLERLFMQRQLEASLDSLRRAEVSLRDFLKLNRQFETSPDLRVEYDRLQRSVQMRQQLYTGLSQAYEQARLSELRDTPALTVVQGAYLPPARDRLGGAILLLVVVALTAALSAAVIVASGPSAPTAEEVSVARARIMSLISSLAPSRK